MVEGKSTTIDGRVKIAFVFVVKYATVYEYWLLVRWNWAENERATLDSHSFHSLARSLVRSLIRVSVLKKWVRLLFIYKMIQSEGVMCCCFFRRFFSLSLSRRVFVVGRLSSFRIFIVVEFGSFCHFFFFFSLKNRGGKNVDDVLLLCCAIITFVAVVKDYCTCCCCCLNVFFLLWEFCCVKFYWTQKFKILNGSLFLYTF